MSTDHKLSDLQVAIMRVLWDLGEATVAQVHSALHADRGLAVTTVATLLSRLEKRGLLTHRSEGRQFVYRPLVTEAEVRSSMVDELTDLLFEGNVAGLVDHLISGDDVGSADLARLKSLIESREREQDSSGDRGDAH